MQTVTLLTDPETRGLDPALCESLRNAWGGGDVVWLAPDEAAEFPVLDRPANFDDTWRECQQMGVDLCIQRTGGRRKKMLIADMDSTMIGQECVDELAAEAGVGERVAGITARAMAGELDFEGALIERVALLEGLDERAIARVLAERISLAPGGRHLVATMRANGAWCVLVSGGFTAFAAPLARRIGFDQHSANVLEVQAGRLTGQVRRPILGRDAKVRTMREAAASRGLDLADVMAVGDGANDLGMLGLAGAGVAMHAKPVVQERCDLRINHGDLTALLYLQGYARHEFDAPSPEPEDYAV